MARLNQHVLIITGSEEIQFRGSKIACRKQANRLNDFFGPGTFRIRKQTDRGWRLKCTYVFAGLNGKDYFFYGAFKAECVAQAKKADKYSRYYMKEWDIVETD